MTTGVYEAIESAWFDTKIAAERISLLASSRN
jgi:hypothetical protein